MRSVCFKIGVILLVSLVLAGCSSLDTKQREWIYRPYRGDWRLPYPANLNHHRFWIAVESSRPATPLQLVNAWWVPHHDPDAPAILFLHGARQNLLASSWRIARFHSMGFSVLAIDYRGFGKSAGALPSEEMTYQDAQAAWQYLKGLQPDPAKRFVVGHSLGGAVAIDLATRNADVAGLIVESSFTSIRDMAKSRGWGWLPLSLLLTQEFDSLSKVRRLRMPVLFVHGGKDGAVPLEMGERLYAAAPEPKTLWVFPQGGHNNVPWRAFAPYTQIVRDFVRRAQSAHPARFANDSARPFELGVE